MNELPPSPTKLLRATAIAARWLWRLLLVAWLLVLASWGLLHGFIVPRIAELRPQLEQQATLLLGVPVQIGAVHARSVGLIPSFELSDVALLDTQGHVALRLPRVVAALSPRSLWRLGFEQLYIDKPELDIRRAADGQIFIAGLPLKGTDSQDTRARKWFFAQTELVVHEGVLRWTDEQRGSPPLALSRVNLLVRNTARRHALHLDAAVPPEWGSRFSVNARFRQPLLKGNTGNWQDWDGQVFANFEHIDVSRLRQYVNPADMGLAVSEGQGALRLWADMRRGQLTGATADVALAEVSVSLDPTLAPLTLHAVTGRLSGKRLPHGFEFATQALQFATQDGRRWPGGNVAVVWNEAETNATTKAKLPPRGELHADQLDVAALSDMANVMPLSADIRAALTAYAPQGVVTKLDAHWTGEGTAPATFDAKGRVTGLQIRAGEATAVPPVAGVPQHPHPGRPGISGATVDFELTQSGGKAQLAVQSGTLVFPGIFDDPVVPVDSLSAEVLWQRSATKEKSEKGEKGDKGDKGDKLAVQVNRLRFANADTEGEAQFNWHTSDPAKNTAHARFPGVLDLQGTLSRGEAKQAHRYLPLVLPAVVRDYVKAAVQQGRVTGVKFRVKGDLHELPFRDPRQGEFRIAANLQDTQFAFVPHGMFAKEGKPAPDWPALTQLSGELVFERTALQAHVSSGRLEGLPGLQITRTEVQIPDLAHPVVQVSGDGKGPLSEALRLVTTTPIGGWASHVLDKTTATGAADYRLSLSLPLTELEKTKVQGSVTLTSSDVQLNPDIPTFSRARGVVSFSESGFALQGVQAGVLGGEIRLDGGTPRPAGGTATTNKVNDPTLLFRAQGTVSAEGLRQARDLGVVSRMAQHASGATSYSATLTVRHGVPEVTLQSTLQGLALNLPTPLNKTADALLPLRFENTLWPASLTAEVGSGGANAGSGSAGLHLQDQLLLELGTAGALGTAHYVRDLSTPQPRLLRGSLGVGLVNGESMPLPEAGVAANLNLGEVDVDAWVAVVSRATGAGISVAANADAESSKGTLEAVSTEVAGQRYLPSIIALRAHELRLDGHKLKNVVMGGSREGLTWRANLEANELSGYVEYRESTANNAGRVYARLARLTVAPSTATQVETILGEQPSNIPALDIVVDDMDLRGKKLGRVEIEAVNQGARATGRDWRLNKFNVTVPEASFSATGNWAATTAPEPRRTVMNYKLDISDAGTLLGRFGMKDVVRQGQGRLEGQVSWSGSPLTLDYPSLGGQFNVNIETGQFLKADPGLAKLLGVLSLQSLPRRLALDFRDVFTEGFAFDFVRGDVKIDRGIATTNNLQMKGVNAAVLMEGHADIAKETQDLKVVVVPEINVGTASLVASVINPVIGLTTFLSQALLRRPLIEAATQEFHIDGAWTDPKIVKVDRKQRAADLPAEARP